MVKYYYDKYTAIPVYQYSDTAPFSYNGEEYVNYKNLYKRYSFDKNTNTYSHSDPYNGGESMGVGGAGFFAWGSRLERYQSKWDVSSVEASILATKSTKDASNNQKSVVGYNKGALQESGIIAEDGTYPLNGYHSDGFWYVRGAVANTAPTMPGAFTQPTGTLEIGDAKVVSWGVSTDAENNLSEYVLERSINGGSFTALATLTANSYTYTIPTATSIAFRVKARDSDGLESAYRTSATFTVQPPQYYYDKFNVIANTQFNDDAPWIAQGQGSAQFSSYYKSYSYDRNTNKYVLGSVWGANGDPVYIGAVAYYFYNNNLYQYVARNYGSDPTISVSVDMSYKDPTKNTSSTSYSKGSLVQTGVIGGATTYPTNGRHTDGYWYVRGSRVSQTIAPPTPFISPASGKKFKPNESANISFGASNAPNLSLYEVDYRYNTTGAWTPLPYNNTLTRSLTITTDKTLKTLELRVRAKNTSNVYSDYVYSEAFVIEHNVVPTVSLTGPGDNTTLYENDSYNIAGTAYDDDKDQSVTVYYQINNEPRKVLATNLSKTQIALSKQLTFKAGKLFDGDTALTGTLTEGVAHTLKVWAVDSENSQSATVERTFYVVPNRAPILTVNPPTPSGIINSDSFEINGSYEDQDQNETTVSYRINGANPVQITKGTSGVFDFNVSLGSLQIGDNTVTVEAIDSYGAKTSHSVKLRKNEVAIPVNKSTARYKITPPTGTASEILVWIQHDAELTLKASVSMTLAGEQESFTPMTLTSTASLPNGQVEDEFYLAVDEAKDSIVLQLELEKSNPNASNAITLIMGVI